MEKKKKIAYISGARSDFGLMTAVLNAISKSKKLKLQLYTTGMHLAPELGSTVLEVKKNFPDAGIINATFKSDEPSGVLLFAGPFLDKLVDVFTKNRPDIVLVLGDRPEMLFVAMACLYLGIPLAHIHGGDRSGNVDEITRHAITKLAQIHFPATKEAARRIERLGEDKKRIHVVGAPSLDLILGKKTLPTREEVLQAIDLPNSRRFILLTLHPQSEDFAESGHHTSVVLAALKKIGLPTVVIYPNCDPGGKQIIAVLKQNSKNKIFRMFPSLDHELFLGIEREASVWVGNSSAAMIESSSFRIPVVNIGSRQQDRQHGSNVTNVGFHEGQIVRAIRKSLFDKKYLNELKKITNPWGDGRASIRIARILEEIKMTSELLNKKITY